MKKLKLFFACLLMAVLSIGQVWAADPAPVGTTLFSEDFSGYAKDAVPSGEVTTATGRVVYGGANVTYSVTNGSGTTKIYTENSAGGTSPEILVGKSNGTLTIAGIPSGGAKAITVSYKQNKQKLKVESTTTGYSGSKDEKPTSVGANSVDITIADGSAETFTLVFTCTGSSNVRVDDILVTVKTAGEGGGSDPVAVTGVTLNKSELELEVDENETLTATVAPGDATDKSVSWSSDDESVATVANGVVTAVAEGTATITVTTTDGSFTDECEVTVIAAAPAVEYVKFTGDIEEGDYVIYYDGKAMKNTVASNRLSYESVTPTNNKVKNPSAAIVWHIAPAATEGYWTMFNEEVSKYAVCTGSNNQANLNASADNAIVSVVEVSEGNYNILSKVRQDAGSNNYYLRENTTYGFAFYASGTGGALTLYKNASAAPAVAKPTISGTDNFLTSTEVTMECSTDGAAIYYTTTESAKTTPATSGDWAAYNSASKPSFSATTTVWAAAKKGDDWSGVTEKTFTKATVMTVAQALEAAAGADKYVRGIIYAIDEVSTEHGNATYYLKDEGQENSIKIYRGKYLDNANFTAVDQIIVGDEVTVTGTISVYSEVNQFAQGNYIVAMKPAARLAWAGTTEGAYNASLEGENTFPTLTNTNSVTVAYSSSDESAATINPSTGAISLEGVGTTTITASFAGNETYKANSVSYTLNVASSVVHATISFNVDGGDAIADLTDRSALPMELPVATKAGKNFGGWFTDSDKEVAAVPGAAITENTTLYAKWLDPYTVAEAKTVIDANPDGIANQYVTGVISQIDSYNNTYHSITYWISADGTTTNQLQVYSGLIGNAATALEKEQFTAKTDLELGDEVVVTGTLKLHNSTTYEFDKNNTIYTFSRKASAGLEYAVTAVNKVVGDADFVNELTNPYEVAVSYATSDDQVAEVANDGTVTIIGEGTATISASFAGNETYKAAVVSYTLTVSATVDTRHIANSPATFTTVSGDMTPNDITFASYQGGAGTAPQNYNNGIRLYQAPSASAIGGYITLTAKAGCTIDEVQITTTSTYATTVTYSVDGNETLLKSESVAKSGSYTTGTGLNVQSVNIVNKGTSSSGRLEIASIKVYYTGEPASIHHYVLGGTYQTAFVQNEDFNHTGLIVYAAYDELEETKVDITSMCTFSEPDMSTTGEKTIEITYNEAVVTSYTINVAADSRKVADSPAAFTTVSGDMTPNDITFASYQGGASTAPANYNDGIRLYQAPSADAIGGFITLKAKKGCTIDQVKITTTNTYATTVAYSVDGNENLLGSASVAKSSDYSTPSGLNVESVNIVNKGTGSSGRLEIASIKVWYTGSPLAIDHYFLGGTYETTFEQYGTFSYEGLTVTAAYDELETITEAVTGFTVEADLSTAGDKKAEVMLNSVKIAEYDITVTASAKEDPALAYSPASVILTLGDALSAPTFSNTHNVSPISYNSDKPAVATVDADGNIALAGGTGVAVITASFAGDEDYIESEATFTITVNEPAEDLTGPWTLASTVAAGDKIIIGATKDANTYAMGKQNSNNRAAVASTLEGATLTPGAATKVFTLVDAGEGKFAILASNGKYLTSATSGSSNNLLEADNYDLDNAKWTISIDGEGVASVVAAAGSKTVMQYNSGSTLFSCYGSANQTNINIYKKGAAPEPVLDWTEVRDELEINRFYTVCLPKAITHIKGATFWTLANRNAAGTLAYLTEEVASVSEPLQAGKPFIIRATAAKLEVVYNGDAVADPIANGALRGLLNSTMNQGAIDAAALAENSDIYMLKNNELRKANGQTGNSMVAYRAYVVYNDLDVVNTDPVPAPGRRVLKMPMHTDAAQGFESVEASEKPMKLMINGQMYILRGEKMYDATGRLVK